MKQSQFGCVDPRIHDEDRFRRRRQVELSESLSQWKLLLITVPLLTIAIVAVGVFRPLKEHEDDFTSLRRRLVNDSSLSDLSVNVTFEDILLTVIFLLCSWLMSAAFQAVGLPSLVGEIVTGFVLGPPLFDICPYPEAMVLIGSFGLIGLVLDSGIHLDVAQLRETGTRAVFLATCGTVFALATGLGIGRLGTDNTLKSAIAVGAAFAPSSLGVSSQVLTAGQALNTPTGQLIIASSVVDDVLGLILLSLLEVLVKESPTALDWILPFLSSFGYLAVLGYLGVSWIPRVLQDHILPRIPESKRDWISFALLFFLLTAYLPLLDYSGASYLTGAFLAGLSFSQLPSVQTSYDNASREIMVWLMRIFFAATIGFQIPVRYFDDPSVLLSGAVFLIPVLAKLPLGLFVPRFQRDFPEDFPFDPYWRDVIITSLSMLCRGEFNFLVASYGLTVGLLSPNQYASVVFAVLVSCVCAPLALARVLLYYNAKAKSYMKGAHPVKQVGDTNFGTRPMFVAIQARTPVQWGLQERFQQELERAGLLLIDHRTWHTVGLNPVCITRIFAQDKNVRVKLQKCFFEGSSHTAGTVVMQMIHTSTVGTDSIKGSPSFNDLAGYEQGEKDLEMGDTSNHGGAATSSTAGSPLSSRKLCEHVSSLTDRDDAVVAESVRLDVAEEEEAGETIEEEEVGKRTEEIRQVMIGCLGEDVEPSDYVIEVARQWENSAFEQGDEQTEEQAKP